MKLRDDVDFNKLIELGFEEDESDEYYWLNNYFCNIPVSDNTEARVVVDMHTKKVSLSTFGKECGLRECWDLSIIKELFKHNLIEL